MKRTWAALGLVLALSVIMPRIGTAQETGKQSRGGAVLHQNFPNPFNPETSIRFSVGGYPNCNLNEKPHKVSFRIMNIIGVEIAVPVLKGGAGSVAGNTPLQNVSLPCGEYVAYWDGNDRRTGREAATGMVVFKLDDNGQVLTIKGINAK